MSDSILMWRGGEERGGKEGWDVVRDVTVMFWKNVWAFTLFFFYVFLYGSCFLLSGGCVAGVEGKLYVLCYKDSFVRVNMDGDLFKFVCDGVGLEVVAKEDS